MKYKVICNITTPTRLIEIRGRVGECVTKGIGPLSVFPPEEEGEQSVVNQDWWITFEIQKYLQYNHPCKTFRLEIGEGIGEGVTNEIGPP